MGYQFNILSAMALGPTCSLLQWVLMGFWLKGRATRE